MAIIFFCQSCGARFEVPPQAAGKKGRCKKCGQEMQVPRAEQLASMAAMPAFAKEAVRPAAVSMAAAAPAPALSSWLRAAATNVGLSPLTIDRLPLLGRDQGRSLLDDIGDSKPYLLAGPDPYAKAARGSNPPNAAVQVWRKETGKIQRLFRWLNESAYLISIPFLFILIFGVATKGRGVALFGATFVVLLNLARIVAGVANLVMVPLRDGLNTRRMKKPFRRILEPVITIGLVILGFTFIPWLSSERSASGSLADRVKAEAVELKSEMKGELSKTAEKASGVDLERLGTQAREKLQNFAPGAENRPNSGESGQGDSPGTAVKGLIEDVGKRVREKVDQAGGRP